MLWLHTTQCLDFSMIDLQDWSELNTDNVLIDLQLHCHGSNYNFRINLKIKVVLYSPVLYGLTCYTKQFTKIQRTDNRERYLKELEFISQSSAYTHFTSTITKVKREPFSRHIHRGQLSVYWFPRLGTSISSLVGRAWPCTLENIRLSSSKHILTVLRTNVLNI